MFSKKICEIWKQPAGYTTPLQCAYCPTCFYWRLHITSPQYSHCIPTRSFHTLIANTHTYWQIHSLSSQSLAGVEFSMKSLSAVTKSKGWENLGCKHYFLEDADVCKTSHFWWDVMHPVVSTTLEANPVKRTSSRKFCTGYVRIRSRSNTALHFFSS